MTETRKLAAILAADIVGYSRLVGSDEDRTLARLRALRSDLIDPTISVHGGRVVKRTGDGALVEFRSVVDAVRCAIEVQNGVAERNTGLPPDRRIELRVGIHIGDIVEESDGDLMGNGVNIAARLEGIAEPNGICLSGAAYEQVRDKLKVAFEDLGDKNLKNIARPVRAYRVALSRPTAREPIVAGQSVGDLALPDKPSIAVLPFQNMSGDPEQEFFADGMVEEIITALSRFHALFVIARNSSFAYKGRAIDVKQVGRELGVRYVLEGSVRKSGSKVRVTGQLIDASTGAHLWAERFDGGLEDIFDLQDQVTASVVGAIAPKVERAEIERARRKPTESLDAYDYFLRGMAFFHEWTRSANNEALSLFYKAIEIDPNFAAAYAMAARSYSQRKSSGWVTDPAQEVSEAARLGRRAGELGREDAGALCAAAPSLMFVVGDFDTGAAYTERALALNPNLAWAWLSSALLKAFSGESEAAIEHAMRAMRISPHDMQIFALQFAIALAHFYAGRNAEASSWAEMACRERPDHIPATCVAAASGALAENHEATEHAMARLRQLSPELRISNLAKLFPIRRQEHFDRWVDAMRKAGLPG